MPASAAQSHNLLLLVSTVLRERAECLELGNAGPAVHGRSSVHLSWPPISRLGLGLGQLGACPENGSACLEPTWRLQAMVERVQPSSTVSENLPESQRAHLGQ